MNTTSSVMAHPFRIFFLATAAYAVIVVAMWLAFLMGNWPLPLGWAPVQWHSHEMLYGFVSAAIAGFVLTAMTNWTGAQPLSGFRLLLLLSLWVVGRLAMALASWLPVWLVALLDLAFLPVLAIYVGSVLLRFDNRRNLVLVAIITLLFSGNVLMHIGFVTNDVAALQLGQLIGFDIISLLMVIIAGRIIPAFSSNWLRNQGYNPQAVLRFPWLEIIAPLSVAALLVADLLHVSGKVLAFIALFAGLANGLRLILWRGWLTRREPLLWILHLAYGWIVLALLLRGYTLHYGTLPSTLWQHVLAVGGIGTLILGVMTRVAVGHTGRPLQLLRFAFVCYLLIIASTLARILTATGLLSFQIGIQISALTWVSAFGLFLILYGPVLISPRPDGRPG